MGGASICRNPWTPTIAQKCNLPLSGARVVHVGDPRQAHTQGNEKACAQSFVVVTRSRQQGVCIGCSFVPPMPPFHPQNFGGFGTGSGLFALTLRVVGHRTRTKSGGGPKALHVPTNALGPTTKGAMRMIGVVLMGSS